jgi:Domain of unknown function (DUF4124)
MKPVRPAPHPLPARNRLAWPPLAALALGSALLFGAAQAQAQWKWRDASGRIQISDLAPPPSVPDKDILQRPGTPRNAAQPAAAPANPALAGATATAGAASGAAPALKPKSPLDQELERKRKAEEQEKAGKARAEEERRAAQRADNCNRARTSVATLESGQRITRVNDKGEREFLDDRQRAAEVQRARDIVASDCR